MASVTRALHVIELSDKGVRCTVDEAALGSAFWLPRACVAWARPPQLGECITAAVPDWLAAKHRQLAGDEASEAKRQWQRPTELVASVASESEHANTQRKTQMANSKDNSGALFRVPEDEKKTDKWPDMKGDILVDGVKYWISGWTRTSEKTGKKFLSLALRRADEKPTEQAKPKTKPAVDYDIPF